MARDFARKFYMSKAWKEVREYVRVRDNGLCQDCFGLGEEVHHIIWLNKDNIDDPEITLNEKNLILLCFDCHRRRHRKKDVNRVLFDCEGNVIPL